MTEPDFNLEGDLAHEEATGKIVYPVGCDTDAKRIAHLEYRMNYFSLLSSNAHKNGTQLDPSDIAAIQRTKEALASARSAQQSQN